MKQYFKVKLNNAAFCFQHGSGETGLSKVYEYKPCCIADNGVILGVNDACDKVNIRIGEPLSEALLKCADLYAEEPRFDIISKRSADFTEICSRFGIVTRLAYDECLISVGSIDATEIHSFATAVTESVIEELGIFADVQFVRNAEINANPYSCTADWSENALSVIAESLCFKLGIDNASAKMFSVEVIDIDGLRHNFDRRLDIVCSDYTMLYFVLKNMIDSELKPALVTANLFDIRIVQTEQVVQNSVETVKQQFRKKSLWDYAKDNKTYLDIISKNNLNTNGNLKDYIKNNPDALSFEQLCAVVEKANTRRLKLGNYYINPHYAQKLSESIIDKKTKKVLINGYCPFMLVFMLKGQGADLYYTNLDERTVDIIHLLDPYSPFELININASQDTDYDVVISNSVNTSFKTGVNILLTHKTFFASDERKQIEDCSVSKIFDFGSYGFNGTSEQFAAVVFDSNALPDTTEVYSFDNDCTVLQKQSYITDSSLPCWVIYRNDKFDSVYSKMQFNLFNVYCNKQLKQRDYNANGDVCVISASCIDSDGDVNIGNDCRHVKANTIKNYDVSDYVERDDVFFAAATSSVLKVGRKPKGCIPNSSTVLLVPKTNVNITVNDLRYFSSDEFKNFYDVALNHQNFLLSTDRVSQYFLGKVVS
ncbi:MAG: hypothetical protein E7571_04190 [Ruminococcaceae bacterium]|nr:hypothetical protein [Oscillospiraceae bacterium]